MSQQPASAPTYDAPPSYEDAMGNTQSYQRKEEQEPFNAGAPGFYAPPEHTPYGHSGQIPVTSAGNTSMLNGPHNPPTQTVIIQQPGLGIHHFHETPVRMVCPTCEAAIITTTTYRNGTLAWVACAVLCLVGCDAGCCLIPFCCDSCQDVVHTCPNCNQTVGVYVRM